MSSVEASGMRKRDPDETFLQGPIPQITEDQARITREHASRWACDDAEYELFTTMLLGDDT